MSPTNVVVRALTSDQRLESDFIGRQSELAALTAALDDASAGRGQIVMLSGEPGIGKTRLAQELIPAATARSSIVLRGLCRQQRGAPPYWPWLQGIRAYIESTETDQLREDLGTGAAEISDILPELSSKLEGLEKPSALNQDQARFRLFFSIATFLKNISRRQPLVIVLDDLHWADESSLLLLEFLGQEIPASALMVVGTFRDVEVTATHPLTQTLGSLVREPSFQLVQLEGFTNQEVGDFVESRAGTAVANATVESLHQRTGDNPLFIGEVVRAVGQAEIMGSQDWVAGIPEALRGAISRRINLLSSASSLILRNASVIGLDFDLTLLKAVTTEYTEQEFFSRLDEVLGMRIVELLSDEHAGCRFGHALVQQAVYEEIPPMQRAQVHAVVAQALEGLHQHNLVGHAGELAHHFSEAEALLGTEKIVRYSLMAGKSALEAYGYEDAIAHFRKGLAARDIPSSGTEAAPNEEAPALLFGLARSQGAIGVGSQIEEAFLALSRAFEYYERNGNVDLAVAAAEFPLTPPTGRVRGVEGLLARAISLVPPDSHEAGRLLSRYGGILGLANADYEGAQKALGDATAIARREHDVHLEVQTLAYSADVSGNHLRWPESAENGLQAIGLATGNENSYSEVLPRWWTMVSLMHLGNLEGARVHAPVLREVTDRRSTPRFLSWLSAVPIAFLSCVEGHWEAGREYTDRGLALSPSTPQLVGMRTLLEFETGKFDQGEIYLDRLIGAQPLTSSNNFTTGRTAMAIAAVARITGDAKHLEFAESVFLAQYVTPTLTMYARSALAMVAVHRGDASAAEEHYSLLQDQRGTMLWTVTTVDPLLGLLSRTMRSYDQALEHFEAAREYCLTAGYRPELAWTSCDYAESLLDHNSAGEHAKAMSLLDESLEISNDLGIRPLAERVHTLQERAETKPGRGSAYPDGLTQRKVEVLQLISGGKTDRAIGEELFISVNTVGNHVGSILNKTNAANRTEAASYANQRGLVVLTSDGEG
jgi:DNA-binding CsgD family transcriptional regulator